MVKVVGGEPVAGDGGMVKRVVEDMVELPVFQIFGATSDDP